MDLLERILNPACTAIDVQASSRKRALEAISEIAAATAASLDADAVYDALQARERLGSTGLGEGVAIPHCRFSCDEMTAVFVRLAEPVEYDAPDQQAVDLLFALIVPEEETSLHLTVLAQLSRAFSEPTNLSLLREAHTAEELRATLMRDVPQEG